MPPYRTGLLIIRAWVAEGSDKPLRASIRTTLDVSNGLEDDHTVVDIAVASATVEAWLGDVLAAAQEQQGTELITKETTSMTTWEFKDLIDLPVVSTAAATQIGRVHEVLFNPAANALFGVVLSPPEKDGVMMLVPLRNIRSIGKDAITVEDASAAEPFGDNVEAQEISAAGGYRGGMNVLTESGESVGKVDKVTINDDGTVANYHSSSGLFGSRHDIEPSEVKSGSKDMLIIADGAREGTAKNISNAS